MIRLNNSTNRMGILGTGVVHGRSSRVKDEFEELDGGAIGWGRDCCWYVIKEGEVGTMI